MDDAALVEAARSGDPTAWGAIYDRYADRLHDHCHRILRDRDEAADALHDAFIAGARNLHQLRDPTRLRPWLYSICRHTSLRRLKARERVDLAEDLGDVSAADEDLGRGVRSAELSELVWAAAAGLNGRDQALLDLNLRQGLEGQDLADAMGTTLSNSYVMLSRLRDQVERSLGALLIARLGREDCEELDGLLDGWDGRFSPLLRKRVARHVDGCEVCSERRRAVVSPLALLAAAPLVPAPAALRGRIISSIRDLDGAGPSGPVHTLADAAVPFNAVGFAAFDDAPEHRRRGLLVAAVAAVLLLVGGVSIALAGGEDTPVQTAAVESSSTLDAADTTDDADEVDQVLPPMDAPTTTAAVAGPTTDAPTTTTTKKPAPAPPGTTKPGVAPPPTAPATTTTTRPSDGQGPAVSASASAAGCGSVAIRAQVTDAAPIEQVTARVTDGNSSFSAPMRAAGGSSYTSTIGDFPDGGSITWTVEATDQAGNRTTRSGTLRLPGCSQPAGAPAATP